MILGSHMPQSNRYVPTLFCLSLLHFPFSVLKNNYSRLSAACLPTIRSNYFEKSSPRKLYSRSIHAKIM